MSRSFATADEVVQIDRKQIWKYINPLTAGAAYIRVFIFY